MQMPHLRYLLIFLPVKLNVYLTKNNIIDCHVLFHLRRILVMIQLYVAKMLSCSHLNWKIDTTKTILSRNSYHSHRNCLYSRLFRHRAVWPEHIRIRRSIGKNLEDKTGLIRDCKRPVRRIDHRNRHPWKNYERINILNYMFLFFYWLAIFYFWHVKKILPKTIIKY